ncbi:MAG: GlsB/YeaQ/YmgE family stress response membrane protein [Myxococcaceae bacterium]
MDLLGFLILLLVAFVAGAIGEMLAGAKVPGGWVGSIVAGLVGAWLGGMLLSFGPVIGGIQIIPAIIGAVLFVFALRLILNATRGGARRRTV